MAQSMFRSEEMKFCTITMIGGETDFSTVKQLGTFGKFHQIDHSLHELPGSKANYYKKLAMEIATYDVRLGLIEKEARKREEKKQLKVPHHTTEDLPRSDSIEPLLNELQDFLDPVDKELQINTEFLKQNERDKNDSIERKFVIYHSLALRDVSIEALQPSNNYNQLKDDVPDSPLLQMELGTLSDGKAVPAAGRDHSLTSYVFGTVLSSMKTALQRMIYRASRGNAFVRYIDIEQPLVDPSTGGEITKSVFVIVVLGEELYSRILKLCAATGATTFEVPKEPRQCDAIIQQLDADIREKEAVFEKTDQSIIRLLKSVVGDTHSSPLRKWQSAMKQARCICEAFIKCRFVGRTVVTDGWCPVSEIDNLRQRIMAGGVQGIVAELIIDENKDLVANPPPTYFAANKYTSVFQSIVDTYGVPRYREINPAVFTIVTFPFLFGVMYGDIGHATVLAFAAGAMIYWEKAGLRAQANGTMNEMLSMAFGGRYMLFLMALFGMYNGLIYNDCFALPMNIFGTTFRPPASEAEGHYYKWSGDVYAFGVDPSYKGKPNELMYLNSLKMKMSVILGVVQMTFGIFLGGLNRWNEGDKISFYFEFIPRVVFMMCTFGYMCIMILIKWCTYFQYPETAPNLVSTMVGMFLGLGKLPTGISELYSGQSTVQGLLLFFAIVSVPIMLFTKPCINKRRNERLAAAAGHPHDEDEEKHEGEHGAHAHGHSFGDEMIHQGIHTIEFVLGCVSNTASYLRLWALSLAHAELALVFWEKLILDQLTSSPVIVFVGFGAWAVATTGVLLMMDVLECFLHALRLHWVEFQNKFFYADGYAFEPFDFNKGELVVE